MIDIELLNDICFNVLSFYEQIIENESLKEIEEEINEYENVLKDNLTKEIIDKAKTNNIKYEYIIKYNNFLNNKEEKMNKSL